MAMARALAPLLVLSVLVTTAPATRIVADIVQEACSKTQFPKVCAGRLTQKPESKKATPRKLAEMFVSMAAEAGSGMAAFVHGKLNGAKDDAVFKCYDSCSDDVEEAVAHLNGLVREPTDGKFLELKSWLSSTLGGTSACEDACKDAPASSDKDDVVKYSLDIEKMLRVTLDLINEASGSMSADIALPPSEASAPFGGYGSSADAPAAYGAEAPGPVAMPVFPRSDGSSPADGASDAPAPSVADSDASAPTAGSPEASPSDASAPSEEASDNLAPSSGEAASDAEATA